MSEPKWEEVTSEESANPAVVADAGTAPADAQVDLMMAAYSIFERGQSKFKTTTGREVTIYPAKMKQLPAAMQFFKDVIGRLETSQLATMIDLVVGEQEKLIAAGTDPAKIDLQKLVTSAALTGKAFNNASIIALLLGAGFEFLPGFVAVFTDVSEEEYGEFDFDDGAMTAMGIFVVNYAFFTQRLLPIVVGFIRSLASANRKGGPDAIKRMLKATP